MGSRDTILSSDDTEESSRLRGVHGSCRPTTSKCHLACVPHQIFVARCTTLVLRCKGAVVPCSKGVVGRLH